MLRVLRRRATVVCLGQRFLVRRNLTEGAQSDYVGKFREVLKEALLQAQVPLLVLALLSRDLSQNPVAKFSRWWP